MIIEHRKMRFWYITRLKLTRILQNTDWCKYTNLPFLTYTLGRIETKFQRNLPFSFRYFQIENNEKTLF